MLRHMAKSKIHGATVTHTELNYEGSITIAADLIRRADILPGERVQVVNLANGSRLETYVIEGPAESGTICLNGPAARAAMVGDRVHIISYCLCEDAEARALTMRTVPVDDKNQLL
jgi:aspartate 1-decarboxylase